MRVDRAAVVRVETCLACLALGVGQSLLTGKFRDEIVRRWGEVVVHLPVCGPRLYLLRRSSGCADGERRIGERRCAEKGAQRKECGCNQAQGRMLSWGVLLSGYSNNSTTLSYNEMRKKAMKKRVLRHMLRTAYTTQTPRFRLLH